MRERPWRTLYPRPASDSPEAGTQTIGREATNQIVVPGVSVSRCHARVDFRDGKARLTDMDSTNGTCVNGKSVSDAVLEPGDVVTLGEEVLTFRAESLVEQTLSNIERLRDTAIPVEAQAGAEHGTASSAMLSDVRSRLDKLDARCAPRQGDHGRAARRTAARAGRGPAGSGAQQRRLRPAPGIARPDGHPPRNLPRPELDSRHHELLATILDMALAVMKAERGFIMLYDPAAKQLVPRIARRMSADIGSDARTTFSRSIAEKVFRSGRAVATTDAQDDFDASLSVVNYAIKSAVCVPLAARGETCGVLYVDTQEHAVGFAKDDTMFLESLAAQASIALENARLYEELAGQKKNIESIVNSMADASSSPTPTTASR